MSWLKFTVLVLVAYGAYFIINIIIDNIKSKGGNNKTAGGEELTFSEEVATTVVHHPLQPIVLQDEIIEDNHNTVWERDDQDTEELNIVSHNINSSTGGITQMSEVIKLAQNNTIDYKRSIVF